jgi:TolA-binding protein
MKLRQLKKQLKHQQRQTAKRNKRSSRRWIWFFLLLLLLVAAAVPVYQQRELTAPQRLFDAAIKLESQGDITGAQQNYQQLYEKYPSSELAPQALLRSGKIWQYDLQQDQQALLSYLQMEHDYPDHSLVESARESAAHIIKYSLRDYSRAIGFYQRLLEKPSTNRDRYLYEIADCYFRLDNYSQARIELETLLAEQPDSSLLPDVLYRKGGLLLLENRLPEARQDWQRLVDEFPESNYSVQARFNLAKLMEEEDRLTEALEMYQQLENFPRPALLKEKIEHLQQRIAAKKKAI